MPAPVFVHCVYAQTAFLCAPHIFLHNAHAFLCAQHFLFVSHSQAKKFAISIRAPFFVRSVFYSRTFLCAQRFLFASHSGKVAIFIRGPFFVRRVLFFLGLPNEQKTKNQPKNISMVVLYISPPLCIGENNNSFKKTLCLMNNCPQDLFLSFFLSSLSRTNSFLFRLWFIKRTIFQEPVLGHKVFGKCCLISKHLVTVFKL